MPHEGNKENQVNASTEQGNFELMLDFSDKEVCNPPMNDLIMNYLV